MTLHQTNKGTDPRVRQGDIFPNVPFYESYKESKGEFELSVLEFPYVLILTQDCDLEQNKNVRDTAINDDDLFQNDKHLISVMVAPLYNAEHLFLGEHLDQIGIKSQRIGSGLKKPVESNQNPRYHYIKFDDSVVLPNSVIDFKHYYTVSLNWLEQNIEARLCGLNPLYRELISQRFSNYLSRIGLPNPTE